MSKIKLYLDVVEELRSLADCIEALARGMADGDSRPKPTQEPKEIKPAITQEMLRELAITLSRSGRKDDIKALLEKYGVKNITAVSETDLESFYADLKAMEDDDNASTY